MSLELLSAVAAVGTFVVIAATAIAAIVQLRHLRTSNQLTGLLNILGRSEDPIFAEWRDDTRKVAHERLSDPEFRMKLEEGDYDRRTASWIHLYNWYDYVGSLVKQGLVPEEAVMDVYSNVLVGDWKTGEDIIAITRRRSGPGIWENFEYLAWLSMKWLEFHEGSVYPRGAQRLPLKDRWLEEDRRLYSEQRSS
ncbi:MAG: hypothetical protein JO194_06645 [Candidatus Eremiobacteraeota bacterium]|nr:hypothetical protein [Candidatus Eremiobacteraeota bacterium]